MLQVRAKRESAGDVADLTRRVIAAAAGLPVIVNDRLDVAVAAGAAGCHLGQDDFPIAEALRLAPPGFWLGGSGGTPEEARRAADGRRALPRHRPRRRDREQGGRGRRDRHRGVPPVHAAAPDLPAVAIGGVTAALVPELLAAGAAGVAVIRAVVGAADPVAATRALRAALDA